MKTLFLFVLTLNSMGAMAVMDEKHELVSDSSRVIDLDEVVVISQPKETFLLRQQPLSSSVFGQQELLQLNVRDLRQLSLHVPSFAMPEYGARLTSSMYMRGLGSRISNSAVGVYYDNIPLLSPAAFNSYFFALDRVDVLRGPQGTLYGANTEGGLVRIYSKSPVTYQGTDVNLSLAAALQRSAEVAHYHRFSDKLAFCLAGFYRAQNGFFQNNTLDEYNDKGDEAGGKLRFIFQPNHRLTFDLTSDYQFTRQNAFPYGLYDIPENTVTSPSANEMAGYKRNMVNTGLNVSYRMNQLLLSSTTSYQFLRDKMDMDIDYTSADRLSLLQRQKMNALTEELVLRSANDGLWQHATGLFASKQWLRTDATVTFGDDLLRPISLGIENAMKNAMVQSMIGRFLGQGLPPAAAQAAAQAAVEGMGVTMSAKMAVPNIFHQPQVNLAAYHESNFTFAKRFTATLGLRFDYTKVQIDYDALGYMAITGGVGERLATYTLRSNLLNNHSTNYTQLLPKVGLSYRLNDQYGNIYTTVTKGFTAGGYNIQLFSDILQNDLNDPAAQQAAQRGDVDIAHSAADYAQIEDAISYKPEESWNYEFGAHLNLWQGRLQADVSFYYMQLRNQQLSVMAPNYGFGRVTVNAGKSSSCGAELSLRGALLDDKLRWTATYGYTRATFKEYTDYALDDHNEYVAFSYKDNKVPYVPEHTFSLQGDYRIAVDNDQILDAVVLGANVTGRGRIYWDNGNQAYQPFYAVLGMHACAQMKKVSVDFWGRNLTDTHYNVFATELEQNSKRFIGQRGLPFQLGVDVRMHF